MADSRDILIRLLGEETVSRMTDRAGDGLDRFGRNLNATERDARDLDRQIGEAEGSLRTLAVAFARTTDAADRTDITRAMRRQQDELRRLTRARGLIPDLRDEGNRSAFSFAAGFAKSLRGAMGPVGTALGVTIGVPLAITLGAAVGGAVLGGVGIGGVIGGVALAAKDSRVRAAGKSLGDAVMGDLESSASRFVQPTIAGIGIIRSAWSDVAGDVDGIFAATSRYIEPLARGIGNMFRELAPGLREAAEAAGPVIREIGEGLPRIGRALGDLFSTVADNADAGASAVRWLFMAVEEGIGFVSGAIDVFSGMYRTLLDVADVAYTVQDALWGWLPFIGDKAAEGKAKIAELKGALEKGGDAGGAAGEKIVGGLLRVGGAADEATPKVRTLGDVIDEATAAAIGSENANIRLEQAIDDAARAAKEGADKGINPNTEAGRKNRLALIGIADAARAASADILKNGGSHDAAAKATERGREKFLAAAKAMGVEKGEAIALANKLFGIPNIDRSVSVATAKAQAAIAAVQAGLGKIHSKNVTVGVYYKSNGDLKLPGGTSIKGAASGGMVTGPGPKGVDSVPMVLAPGEGVLTDGEVDALGGPSGFARLRAAIRSGGGIPAVAAVSGAGARVARGQVVNLHATFNVNVSPTANLAEVGRQNALALDAWARANGIRWRAAS